MEKYLRNRWVKLCFLAVASTFSGVVGAMLVHAFFSQDLWSAYGAVGTWVTGAIAAAIACTQFKEYKQKNETLRKSAISDLEDKTASIALKLSLACSSVSNWTYLYAEKGLTADTEAYIRKQFNQIFSEWPEIVLEPHQEEFFSYDEIRKIKLNNDGIIKYVDIIKSLVNGSSVTPNNYLKIIELINYLIERLTYVSEVVRELLHESLENAKLDVNKINHGL